MDLRTYRKRIDERLDSLLQASGAYLPLREACLYSVQAGGKRLRPVLHLLAHELAGGTPFATLDFACAIEMIHTYSLIHDDLPAMDNDALRRGRPTNHVVFGDAMAILAGDGLLTEAFRIMASGPEQSPDKAVLYARATEIVGRLAGLGGMVSGQAADMDGEQWSDPAEQLLYIHAHKTGALIQASLLTGCILAGGTQSELDAVRSYGGHLGLAFQITDDILDVEGETAELGKATGRDAAEGKLTFPQVFGLREAKQRAVLEAQLAADALSDLSNASTLQEIALSIPGRTK